MLKSLIGMVSPAGKSGKLSVLIFHRILPVLDPLFPKEIDAARFDQICRWLKSWFTVLPLDEAIARLKAGSLPARALSITFDDGYADNHEVAMPILKRHRLSATFFIATGYLDGGRMWNDTVIEAIRNCKPAKLVLGEFQAFENCQDAVPVQSVIEKRTAIETILGHIKYIPVADREIVTASIARQCGSDLPDNLMMTSEQVIEMRRAGMLIGAHTVTHPILAKLDASKKIKEISESKQYLESLLQEKVGLFAYPNGKPNLDFQARDAELIRKLGFDAALTTAWGAVDSKSDLMQLPRFTPWDQTRVQFGARLIKNILQNGRLRLGQIAS